MTVDHVRLTLRERIALTRGTSQRQREALWAEAVRFDPRQITRRQLDGARAAASRLRRR